MNSGDFLTAIFGMLPSCTSIVLSNPLKKMSCAEKPCAENTRAEGADSKTPCAGGTDGCIKIRMRKAGKGSFSAEFFGEKQVFHKTFPLEELKEFLKELPYAGGILWRQCIFTAEDTRCILLANKKGRTSLSIKDVPRAQVDVESEYTHNRQKNYLIDENAAAPFLHALGLAAAAGKIIAKKYAKFRQINRFLEYADDVLGALTEHGAGTKQPLRIIDFGCGKAYLTFALYYFLTEVKGLQADITGVDLKRDVIEHCSDLARKLNYGGLHFEVNDIRSYALHSHADGLQAEPSRQQDEKDIDMVISLHACDTATDYALAFALQKKAKVILSAPCCQHELNGALGKNCPDEAFNAFTEYGIVKERFAALATDIMRARLIKKHGYAVQILEFIDTAHTPKNLLIRAIRHKNADANKTAATAALSERDDVYENLCRALGKRIILESLSEQPESAKPHKEKGADRAR